MIIYLFITVVFYSAPSKGPKQKRSQPSLFGHRPYRVMTVSKNRLLMSHEKNEHPLNRMKLIFALCKY